MKKNVMAFGLISGAIVCIVMVYSSSRCYVSEDFQASEIVGYASMIIAFSMIFVAVRNYRDKFNGGVITFGKAFLMGLYITALAGAMYVAVWTIHYHFFVPDFFEKYMAYVKRQSPGDTEKVTQIEAIREWYRNPFFFVFMTFMEIFPVGLVMSLISALILKRRAPDYASEQAS